MSEENKIENEVNETETEESVQEEEETQQTSSEEVDDPVEKAVQERLAQMKSNMDRMVKERDEALKKAAEIEQKQKQEQIKRLEEEGKLQEALEMKLAEAQAKLKVFEEENTKLNRDNVVNSALGALDFRNDRSRQMAYRDIVEQLVQDEQGSWVHQSGTTIQDFIKAYSTSEDNSFLFRVKTNSGSGADKPAGTANTDGQKSISQMTTQEILNAAAKGQLGNYNI